MLSATRVKKMPVAGYSLPLRYLIARSEKDRLTLFTLASVSRGETLPVFNTGRAAHDYLRLKGFDGGWRVRESTAGELISLLFSNLAGVECVVVDPGSSPKGSRSVGKSEFVAALMGESLAVSAS